MSRILVTGGSGFIGSNLVASLLNDGHAVRNLDLVAPEVPAERAVWQQTDLLDRKGLTAAFQAFQPELVYHLAARTDLNGRSLADYAANTTGVDHVIEAAAATAALRRIVFASSRLVCRIGYQPTSAHDYLPTTPYGESKVAGEKAVYAARGLKADWTIVRPTSIWGPRFRVPYRTFFDAIRRGRYVHPRGVEVRKSFGYIGNTVTQLQRLATAPSPAVAGGMFYLADYQPLEVLSWSRAIAGALAAPPVREVPWPALKTLAVTGDLLAAIGWKSVPLTSFRLDNLVTPMVHDLSSLEAVCGALPFTAQDGVEATVRWIQQGPRAA